MTTTRTQDILAWPILELPPGTPLATTQVTTGLPPGGPEVALWQALAVLETDLTWSTQALLLQITRPDGIWWTIPLAAAVPASTPLNVAAGVSYAPGVQTTGSYITVGLPRRAWPRPVGVRILGTAGGLFVSSTWTVSQWLVSPTQ